MGGKGSGRDRTTNPKIILSGIRVKISTLGDIDIVAKALGITKNKLVQVILDNEIEKYKLLVSKKDF